MMYTRAQRDQPPGSTLICPGCEKVFDSFGDIIGHFERNKFCKISKDVFEKLGAERMAFAQELQRRHHGMNPFAEGSSTASSSSGTTPGGALAMRHMNALRPVAEATVRPDPVVLHSRKQASFFGGQSSSRSSSDAQSSRDLIMRNNPSLANPGGSGSVQNTNLTSRYPEWDPRNRSFDPKKYYSEYVDKYQCPHKYCFKSWPTIKAFKTHLLSQMHQSEKEYSCPCCFDWFPSRSALAHHIESPMMQKCKIRDSQHHGLLVSQLSAGLVDASGRNQNGSQRYVITEEAVRRFGRPLPSDDGDEGSERASRVERPEQNRWAGQPQQNLRESQPQQNKPGDQPEQNPWRLLDQRLNSEEGKMGEEGQGSSSDWW